MTGLFIWVEGTDDLLFFEKVLRPIFELRYDWVKVLTYARERAGKINAFLRSVKAMQADYIFVTDQHPFSCVTQRKARIIETYQACDDGCLQVVVQEIESWYLSGVTETTQQSLKLPQFKNTDDLTKEQFNQLIPGNLVSRLDIMSRLLDDFSLPLAMQRNRSFAYFAHKYQLSSQNE
jgi:hypothetical protein